MKGTERGQSQPLLLRKEQGKGRGRGGCKKCILEGGQKKLKGSPRQEIGLGPQDNARAPPPHLHPPSSQGENRLLRMTQRLGSREVTDAAGHLRRSSGKEMDGQGQDAPPRPENGQAPRTRLPGRTSRRLKGGSGESVWEHRSAEADRVWGGTVSRREKWSPRVGLSETKDPAARGERWRSRHCPAPAELPRVLTASSPNAGCSNCG